MIYFRAKPLTMKRILLLSALLLTSISFSQEIPKCLSHEAIKYQESLTPGFESQVNKVFNTAKNKGILPNQKTGNHVIPVVVHVVYNLPEANLPDSVIFNQIAVLNEDYNRLNADTVNMRSDFDIVKGSPNITFVLAQIDELGAPTNGITRTQTATTTFGSLGILTGDFTDLEKVKSTVDGGSDPWDQSRYLNIWVCDMSVFGITALLGYATPPAGLPNWPAGSTNGLSDGVVIQYQAFGSNNPVPLDPGGGPIDVMGRTATHEVGHYLGLRHIWGDGDCTAQDGIDDTPNADAQSDQDCDPSKNTCADNIQTVDLPDMIENFMDYSAETCQNSFTTGQASLILGVLESERYDLVHGNPASIEAQDLTSFKMYPNPSNSNLTLEFNGELEAISIVDIYGKSALQVANPQSGLLLDVSNLANGVYFVSYELDGAIQSERFIKQ